MGLLEDKQQLFKLSPVKSASIVKLLPHVPLGKIGTWVCEGGEACDTHVWYVFWESTSSSSNLLITFNPNQSPTESCCNTHCKPICKPKSISHCKPNSSTVISNCKPKSISLKVPLDRVSINKIFL